MSVDIFHQFLAIKEIDPLKYQLESDFFTFIIFGQLST